MFSYGEAMSDGYAIFDSGQEQKPPTPMPLSRKQGTELLYGFRKADITDRETILQFVTKVTGYFVSDFTQLVDAEQARIMFELRRLARQQSAGRCTERR